MELEGRNICGGDIGPLRRYVMFNGTRGYGEGKERLTDYVGDWSGGETEGGEVEGAEGR